MRKKKSNPIIIVERAPSILGPLPQWMKEYVSRNLRALNIEVLTNSVIETIGERRASISDKGTMNNTMVIWAAGVRTADFLQKLDLEKNPQGRVKVDEYLRLNQSCFVVGDTAYFSCKNIFLRMAVQFAIAQAHTAVDNIVNASLGKALRKYVPLDLGYIIPMANNRSCGNVLGMDMREEAATFFHYCMSVYRSYGFRNKVRIIKAVSGF